MLLHSGESEQRGRRRRAPVSSPARVRIRPPTTAPAALVFDVFGTVVDWRATVIRESRRLGRSKGLTADWARFADAWRGGYAPSMDRVRRGELPWTNLDGLNRTLLDALLVDDGKVALMVRKVDNRDVVCEVMQGGTVSDHKGLSLPRMNVSMPALSAKDIADLQFAWATVQAQLSRALSS